MKKEAITDSSFPRIRVGNISTPITRTVTGSGGYMVHGSGEGGGRG